MSRYTLTPRTDLAVFHAADAERYAGTPMLDLVGPEVFRRYYADSPSRGFACDGQPIGGMIFDGRQAHLAVLSAHHGHWGRLLRPTLDWLFGLQPEMRIDIECDNPKALAFMDRNGWPRVAGAAPGSVGFWVSALHRRRRPGDPDSG
ncbi:GNAT family N-acetyltransferase [Xylophilus sp. Kf1]|nr:GNAT family N-acetyltransferase [Xylophilus sp. Kf1]